VVTLTELRNTNLASNPGYDHCYSSAKGRHFLKGGLYFTAAKIAVKSALKLMTLMQVTAKARGYPGQILSFLKGVQDGGSGWSSECLSDEDS
jgi:hypothetical protein